MFKWILKKTTNIFLSYQNSFITIKKLFRENSSSALQQSIKLSSSSEIDNIIQEGEVIFKKNPTVGLPEVSKLIDSAISKRQGDQRKHSFLEKKYSIKGKMVHYKHAEISHHLMTHQFHKIFFHISKCLACNAEKYYSWK